MGKIERVSSEALQQLPPPLTKLCFDDSYYRNPGQLLAGVYPAALAAAIESKVMRLAGLMRLAPGQSGRWYFVPDLEPTTATGLVVGEEGSVVAFVVVAGETASTTAAGVTISFVIKGFSEFLEDVTERRPRPKEATATKTSKTL